MQQAEESGDVSFDVAALESDLEALYQDDSPWLTQEFSSFAEAAKYKETHGLDGKIQSLTVSGGPKLFGIRRAQPPAFDLFADTGESQPRLPGAEDVRE